jgi:hypothetical protein
MDDLSSSPSRRVCRSAPGEARADRDDLETIVLDRISIGAITLAVLLLGFAGAPAFAGEMKFPDWEGQWRNPRELQNSIDGPKGYAWDITKPMGLRQEAPLTLEYQAIFEASVKDQAKGGQGNSKGASCILPGMPKVMSFSEPVEVRIRPAVTYFLPQRYPPRRIYTDGREMPADTPPTFGGYSLGKWIDDNGDGRYDVLEVETRNFKGPRVFESSGLPLHEDNQTIVKERIYLDKDDNDLMHDDVTTIDHALTRPWTVDKKYIRDRDPKWVEANCHGINNHVFIGAEDYFLSTDGELMPVRKGQPPPDLQNFR